MMPPPGDSELQAELAAYRWDSQHRGAMGRILSEYLRGLRGDIPRQGAVWIAGLTGSGKTQLLKVLGHLWQNTEFGDGRTARELVAGLPDDVHAQLRELDEAAATVGVSAKAIMKQLAPGDGGLRDTIALMVREGCQPQAQWPIGPDVSPFRAVRRALGDGTGLPLLLVVLDDLDRQLAGSQQNAIEFGEAMDWVRMELNNRLLVVGSGQYEIWNHSPTLRSLADRILSRTETITRRHIGS